MIPVILALLLAAGAAFAQPSALLRIELNRLEPRDGGACRIWLVLNNGGAEALDPVRLDLVLFGRDGVIARRIAVDVGPLPAGRVQARIFDLTGQACEGLGQVLLNDFLACGTADAAPRAACMDRAALASRVEAVPFQK
jgi:hypothetical protein